MKTKNTPDKKRPRLYLEFRTNDPPQYRRVDIDAILSAFKIKNPQSVVLVMEQEQTGRKLITEPFCDETYPGMTTVGVDEHGNSLALTQAELPNEDYTGAFTARFYAGYDRTEPDEPIALTLSKVRNPEEIEADEKADRCLTKLIYVDYDLAATASWVESLRNEPGDSGDITRFKEHVED